MTYEQYLKDFLADVIKATGMTFDNDYSLSSDGNCVGISVSNTDIGYNDLSVVMRFDGNTVVEDFEKDFSVHREAAVRLTSMAYVSQILNSTILYSTGVPNQPLCEVSMYSSMSISISANGDYEYYERNWNRSKLILSKTYSKPTKTQIAAFAKNTFLKIARDDAASDVENTIDRLKEYHEDYVRQNKRLRLIDEMLS